MTDEPTDAPEPAASGADQEQAPPDPSRAPEAWAPGGAGAAPPPFMPGGAGRGAGRHAPGAVGPGAPGPSGAIPGASPAVVPGVPTSGPAAAPRFAGTPTAPGVGQPVPGTPYPTAGPAYPAAGMGAPRAPGPPAASRYGTAAAGGRYVPGIVTEESLGQTTQAPTRASRMLAVGAVSPLSYLIVVVVTVIVLIADLIWGGLDALRDESGDGGTGQFVVAVLLIAAASIVMLLWIRRIGRNAGLFGGWLVLASVFPWDRFAYVGGATADLTVVQVRVTVGLLIGLGSVLLFRRRVVVLTWRAGRMPAPIIAELTWIISFLGQVLVSVALLQVVFSAEEYSTPFVRGYRFGDPNTTMIMVGLLCIGASAACWLAELIAVTISQHLAIVEERRASPQPA